MEGSMRPFIKKEMDKTLEILDKKREVRAKKLLLAFRKEQAKMGYRGCVCSECVTCMKNALKKIEQKRKIR